MICFLYSFTFTIFCPIWVLSQYKISHEIIFNQGICEYNFSSLINVDFTLPKRVHLNDVSFPTIKEHKSLASYLSFSLPSCSLRLNTITLFAFSTRLLIDFDIYVATDTLSLISILLFTFDSLLL